MDLHCCTLPVMDLDEFCLENAWRSVDLAWNPKVPPFKILPHRIQCGPGETSIQFASGSEAFEVVLYRRSN